MITKNNVPIFFFFTVVLLLFMSDASAKTDSSRVCGDGGDEIGCQNVKAFVMGGRTPTIDSIGNEEIH